VERLRRVSPRTIRRDIDRLRELGYPVQATMGAGLGRQLEGQGLDLGLLQRRERRWPS
jgi:predicted DNA-binding transcriptional regulator YafY